MGIIRMLLFWGGVILLIQTGMLTLLRRMPSSAALLAFESQRGGNLDIYLMRPDGVVLTNLTQHPGYDGQPAWSPDGKHLAFTSRRTGNLNIYVTPIFGDSWNLTQSPYNDKSPAWSPDGGWLLFESDRTGNLEIFKIRLDGSELVNLTQHRADEVNAQWSPDGNWIAFESNRLNKNDVYLMRPDGSEVVNITDSLGYDGAPVWSSDGLSIAFVSGRDIPPRIYLMRRDGSEQTRLPVALQGSEFPDWLGDWIAFDSIVNGNREVFRVRADGTGLENLSQHPGYDGNPAWSPVVDAPWRNLVNWITGVVLLGISRRCSF